MKNLLQNLLVAFALCLCGLCVWQWFIQARLYRQGQTLEDANFQQASQIRDYTNSIKSMETEIAGLSAGLKEMNQAAKTNGQIIAEQKREIARLTKSGEVVSNQISQYKELVDKLDAKLKEATAGITKQNDSIKELIAQRDEAIKKYNDSVKERNEVVEKYNALVDRFNKLQGGAGTEGTKP